MKLLCLSVLPGMRMSGRRRIWNTALSPKAPESVLPRRPMEIGAGGAAVAALVMAQMAFRPIGDKAVFLIRRG